MAIVTGTGPWVVALDQEGEAEIEGLRLFETVGNWRFERKEGAWAKAVELYRGLIGFSGREFSVSIHHQPSGEMVWEMDRKYGMGLFEGFCERAEEDVRAWEDRGEGEVGLN